MKVSQNEIANSISNDILHLIILPTEECNFKCVYCYETFKFGRMKPNVVNGIKEFINSRISDLKLLTISWFGGEPLLALDIVEDIMKYVQSLLKENKEVTFVSDMTTNAYCLTIPVFRKLVGFGVCHYQISFDGPKELHNRKRVLANGRGTFDRIWNNLVNLKNTNEHFNVHVSLHLDYENYPHIFMFLREYEAFFKDDPRFKLFFRPLSCLGGANDRSLPVFNNVDAKRNIKMLSDYMQQRKISYKTLDDAISLCYAAKPNCFVLRASGIINKCTVALENEQNQVGHINVDGSLMINTKTFLRWARGLESGRDDELLCPLKGLET